MMAPPSLTLPHKGGGNAPTNSLALDGGRVGVGVSVAQLSRLPSPRLLVITDRLSCRGDVIDVVAAAFAGGARWAMLREKDLPRGEVLALAKRLVQAGKPYNATVLVNGDVEIAVEAGAAGVHLPQGQPVEKARRIAGAQALIGVSAHSLEEVRAAAADGADYATLSPIFRTESKPGYGPALGIEALRAVAREVALPLVALAGVTATNARLCIDSGAAGVAAMGSIMRSSDPKATVSALIGALGKR